ncbi:MAG: PhoH family protein, partial [Nitrospinota bacterium]
PTVTDNKIVEVAFRLHKKKSSVVFVSKDINARLKADSLGMKVRDFEKQKINFDELFSGYREVPVSGEIIDNFYKEAELGIENFGFFPNEFVMLKNKANEKQTAMGAAKDANTLRHLNGSFENAWNIKPLNREQRIAMELLLDTSINIVTLVGQAGSGKTLLALAAALETCHRHKQYDKILVTRPIVPLGKDIGYLPGDKEEKLAHWMQPIFDNLSYLMRSEKNSYDKEAQSAQSKVERLLKNHVVEMEALTYIRGRSIPKQYVIVDEAQNLTPHEIKTIISRAGEGTKMVLTGDPYQIDNPYLDSNSNGLAYAVDRLKNHPIHGHITLRKSERSKLAAIAADLL